MLTCGKYADIWYSLKRWIDLNLDSVNQLSLLSLTNSHRIQEKVFWVVDKTAMCVTMRGECKCLKQ